MKQMTSRKRRLLLTKNLIMMLVVLVLIIVSVTAWFTVHKQVTANNMSVQALSTNIDIAPCIKTYDNNYNVVTDGPGEFTNSLTFPDNLEDDEKIILTNGNFSLTKDCTGDGLLLIVPDFNITVDYESVRKTTGKDVNLTTEARAARSQQDSWKEKMLHPDDEVPAYDYIQLEFYVRSKNPDLRLDERSQLLGKVETPEGGNGSVFSNPVEGNPKRSAYGNFNVDALVGAMRVSLIAEACNNVTQTWDPLSENNYRLGTTNALHDRSSPVKQLLWVPRPDVQLNIPDTHGDISGWSISQRQQSSWASNTNTYYQNLNDHLGVELVNDNNAKTKISSGVYNGRPCLGSNVNISDFSSQTDFERHTVQLPVEAGNNENTADYYVTKYTMKIWIEGSDFEARRAMDGGEFSLKLYFT